LIKYLIWDAGGTLFDTYPAVVEACHAALSGFGKEAPSAWVMALCKQTTSYGIHTLANTFALDEETFNSISSARMRTSANSTSRRSPA